MGARVRSGREAALEHDEGVRVRVTVRGRGRGSALEHEEGVRVGLELGLGLAHLSMTRALEAERRMTKRRVEMSERYCVMRSSTSIIAMAKTTLEIAMTLTWMHRVASCVHEAAARIHGNCGLGGVAARGAYGVSDGGRAPRA